MYICIRASTTRVRMLSARCRFCENHPGAVRRRYGALVASRDDDAGSLPNARRRRRCSVVRCVATCRRHPRIRCGWGHWREWRLLLVAASARPSRCLPMLSPWRLIGALPVLAAVPQPGLTLPVGTGPVWPVTGQTGPDRFRFRPVPNRPKFKI